MFLAPLESRKVPLLCQLKKLLTPSVLFLGRASWGEARKLLLFGNLGNLILSVACLELSHQEFTEKT